MKIDMSGEEIRIYDFNAQEAYRIARRMESEGVKLYRNIAGKVSDSEVARVLEALLAEEVEHLRYFSGRVRELTGPDAEESDLVEIASVSVIDPLHNIKNPEEVLSSREKAIKLGLLVEARAAAFYRSLLENTSDEAGRKALEEIIAEEEKHAERLKALA